MKFFLMLFSVFYFAFIVYAELEEFGNDEAEKEAYKKCLKKYSISAQDISPFEYALLTQNEKLIKEMIKRGVKVKKNAIASFASASSCDDFDEEKAIRIIELLLKQGALPNATLISDGRGPTVLAGFAGAGRLKMVKFMLKKGADINGGKSKGFTPLFYSFFLFHRDQNLETAKYLIEKGADVNKTAEKGKTTPLMFLASRAIGAKEKELKRISFLIDLLLEHGADPFALNKDGETALDQLYVYSKALKYPVPPEIEKKLKKAMEKKK